jgi:uncharacterized membrane protein
MRGWLVGLAFVAVAACSGGNQGSASTGTANPTADAGPVVLADAGTVADAGAPLDAGAPADAGVPVLPPIISDAGTPDAGPIGGGPTPDAGTGFAVVEIPHVVGASGGTFTVSPASINNLGQVVGGFNDCVSVGMSECAGGPFSAFIYDPAKGTTTRIAIADATDHTANGINDTGSVIFNGNPRGASDGFVLMNGVATHFGDAAQASGINAQGFVAGTNQGTDGKQFAFLWDGATTAPIGPSGSLGVGLNDAGVVVGSVSVSGRLDAAAFTAAGTQDLGGLSGAVQTIALAVNDSGRVVGRSFVGANFVEHGFVFDLPAGPMVDIMPGGSSGLFSVNAAGDAVGSSFDGTNQANGAILWHDGAVADLTAALGDPAWQLISAAAINDKGQITGVGMHNGVQAAYVLTPK